MTPNHDIIIVNENENDRRHHLLTVDVTARAKVELIAWPR